MAVVARIAVDATRLSKGGRAAHSVGDRRAWPGALVTHHRRRDRVPGFPAPAHTPRTLGRTDAPTNLTAVAAFYWESRATFGCLFPDGPRRLVSLADRAALRAGESVCGRQGARHGTTRRARCLARVH